MEVINELYENIYILKKNINPSSSTIHQKPKKDLQQIIDFIESNIDLIPPHEVDKLRTWSVEFNKDEIKKCINTNLKQINYIIIKNCINNLRYFEQQWLLLDLNKAILDSNTSNLEDSKISIIQRMSSYNPGSPFDITSSDDVYELPNITNSTEVSTFDIEYNINPLVNDQEALTFGPLQKWTSGLNESIVKRYKNIGIGTISKKTKVKSIKPSIDLCIGKKFFIKINDNVRRYSLNGKNTYPFKGASVVLNEWSTFMSDSSNITYDLDIEPPKIESEYPIVKGGFLQLIEKLSESIKKHITKDIPLDLESFYNICIGTQTRIIIESIIYKLYSNYLDIKVSKKYEQEVRLCTYETVEELYLLIIKQIKPFLIQYLDNNTFMYAPDKRIASLMYTYELSIENVFKTKNVSINEKLILIKHIYK